ncbi:MAG: peptidyl-prolyl cis-trans isomerase [Candidatus Acidiferrales bacterium]
MRKLLREPLVHFLLLGAGLFLLSGLVGDRTGGDSTEIVITPGHVEHLVAGFTRAWQRPPTQEELEGLVRDYVREEVYYREALAMGLDKDDTIIRRRLRQKMEFLSEDVAAHAEPSDEDLRAYMEQHPEAFRVDQSFSFSHVYLNPERHGKNLERDAEQLLARLNRAGTKADPTELGDPFLLDHTYSTVSAREAARDFGEKFAARVGELPVGLWEGPVESGYGMHLVLVRERTEGRVPELAEVRDAVRREWTNARRLEANEKFYHALLQRYTVTIEPPQPTVAEAKSEAGTRP